MLIVLTIPIESSDSEYSRTVHDTSDRYRVDFISVSGPAAAHEIPGARLHS
jgi:hypothetical protein